MKNNKIPKIDEIKKILIQQKSLLKKKYRVKEIGIFGSYARGKEKRRSDVDLLVEFTEPVSLLDFIKVENYLTDVLGIKVDLVMKDVLKPRIGKHILSEVVNV